jgi:hypothetical protein
MSGLWNFMFIEIITSVELLVIHKRFEFHRLSQWSYEVIDNYFADSALSSDIKILEIFT